MSHASKIILRIVVTLLILALVGVSVWLIFFRPSDSLTVFDTLVKLEKEEKYEYTKKMHGYTDEKLGEVKGVSAMNYVDPVSGDDLTFAFNLTSETNQTEATRYGYIQLYRAFMFKNASFAGIESPYKEVANVFNTSANLSAVSGMSFDKIYESINSVYSYYLYYVQLAEGFDKTAINNINNSINNFKGTLNSLTAKADEILKLQTQIPTKYDATVVGELYRSYGDLYARYFEVLKSFNNLTINLKNFVNKYVFDSNVVYDSVTVSNEIATKTISEFTNKQVVDPVKFFAPKGELTEEEETAYNEEFKSYQVFLSHAYDAAITYKFVALGTTNILSNEIIQYYVELQSYNGDNAATANAITGSQNIFTLTRKVKSELVKNPEDRLEGEKAPSDLYYTDNFTNDIDPEKTFGYKIVELIKAIYNTQP